MKTKLNQKIQHSSKTNEIALFQIMASLFNSNISQSTFVKETHGRKGFIEFYSEINKKSKIVEIADILLITYNKRKSELRICFLQAKYKKERYTRFLSFIGNAYQWELLTYKPGITDVYHLGYPPNILNFSNYESITAYGVFYVDILNEINFLYTIPKFIIPKNIYKEKTTMNFFGSPCRCPDEKCNWGIRTKETISTCSIDIFEEQVLAGNIGAPIKDFQTITFVNNLLLAMGEDYKNNETIYNLINILKTTYNNDLKTTSSSNYYPNTIIIITDGNVNKNPYIMV